ncbi:MAG TPA: hypothetical protein DCS78_09930, partial [Pseudoalteromonas shioyasakiensis]|nr:hypothetical protein [Pseudoalteromonas shioyasakiensis]
MTTRQTVLAAALPLALLSTSAMADLSTTVTLASDYTFNGVSQTMNDPAIQGSLDYAFADSGMYVGTWASNVDFGDGTDIEWDAYFGNVTYLMVQKVSLNRQIPVVNFINGDPNIA